MKALLIVAALVFGNGVFNPSALAESDLVTGAYVAGDYSRAIRYAEESPNADHLAMAARAGLAIATLTADRSERDEAVKMALGRARRALQFDPAHVEAHLQAAIALGLEGRRIGGMRAHFLGLADEARGHITAARQAAQDGAWAHALEGAWHLEIVAEAGTFPARELYGATVQEGVAAFERAIALDPANPVILYKYGLALLHLNPEGYTVRSRALFSRAGGLPARTALEAALSKRAIALARALAAGDDDGAARLLAAYRGGYESPSDGARRRADER